MQFLNVSLNLGAIAQDTLLAPEVRAAVAEARHVLESVRSLVGLEAGQDSQDIILAVQRLTQGAQADAFSPSKVVASVANLRARYRENGEALEYIDSKAQAAPLEDECRIILAAIACAKEIYGGAYFDPAQVEG